MRFVAKSEVELANFWFLAKKGRSIFIRRNKQTALIKKIKY